MYRVLLILAVIYAVLRLAIQIFLFSDAMRPEAVAEGVQVSADLQQSYIASAQHFQARQDLYLKGSLEHVEAHYLYSPAFAFFFSPLDNHQSAVVRIALPAKCDCSFSFKYSSVVK